MLHVIHSLDPKSGGPSNALRELVRRQYCCGLDVQVLATNTQSGQTWQDDTAYRESILAEPLWNDVPVELVSSLGRRRPWSRYSWSPTVAGILRKRLGSSARPDVVHIHGVFSHITQSAARLTERAGIPYLIRPAGALDLGCLQRGHATLKKTYVSVFLRQMLRQCAFVHVTSEQEQESVRQQFPGVRTEIVPHGMQLEDASGGEFGQRLQIPKGSPFVLCLCRIHPIKRLDLAIRAFAAVMDEVPDLRLVIVGNDAGALDELKRLAASEQLGDRCLFSGFVTGADKAAAYSEARLFLHPSDHENFGLSVVEAMGHGCPVVTTRGVASGVYVEKSGAGVVVDSDADTIAAAMRELLNQERTQAGSRGADYVQRHLTWDRVVRQLNDLYTSVVVQGQAC